MHASPALFWFRQDLRLADNPGLFGLRTRPLLAAFVLDDEAAGAWAYGGAQRWWLHHSLKALGEALEARGIGLHLASGDSAEIIPRLAAAIGAEEVVAARMYEPWAVRRDGAVARALAKDGRSLTLETGALLHDPDGLRTGAGKPYSVYTPFARALSAQPEAPPPLPAPQALHPAAEAPQGLALDDLGLLPRRDWWREFPQHWMPGEAGAQRALADAGKVLPAYGSARDFPARAGTSRLSPHLHFGEVSPRQVFHAARGEGAFLKELYWREFSYHLLAHRPEMPEQPLRPEFARMPWRRDARALRAWQQGRTGYPFIDAGMRQLWRTGWMHNRVRMATASFLVKHLLLPWQEGEAWFWDTLLDADLANNSANWQWVAGSGVDASPFFRIFNPITQGEKFDADGAYVREWVPELAKLPAKFLHCPWLAPAELLSKAGIELGRDYPRAIVAHEEARARALAGYAGIRAS
ncbi:cryptochrome/photolyase family protein [Roseococcus sp. YIM B11640]|uniref:cryptochrome/photolyase family protein n=1 Tax=Roseococcus sp. YIM B11640 TaxID=3133973 RepID=UPI003C7C5341